MHSTEIEGPSFSLIFYTNGKGLMNGLKTLELSSLNNDLYQLTLGTRTKRERDHRTDTHTHTHSLIYNVIDYKPTQPLCYIFRGDQKDGMS